MDKILDIKTCETQRKIITEAHAETIPISSLLNNVIPILLTYL